MFKKLFFLLTILSTLTVHAKAPVTQLESLSQAYDELSFALEVEWDQENKKFYSQKISDFQKTVESLQEAGMTNEELLEFAKRNVNDKNIAKDLDNLVASVKSSEMTASETREFVINYIGNHYSSGASWAGDVAATVGVVAILVVIVVAIALADTVVIGGGTTGCYDTYEEYVCYDYYDDWYGYWYTDCYWESYCY